MPGYWSYRDGLLVPIAVWIKAGCRNHPGFLFVKIAEQRPGDHP